MIPATTLQNPDGTIELCLPNTWPTRMRSARRSFLANIQGRRVEVFVGANQSLWYYNNWRDASDFDERTGQQVVAATAAECIRWIRSYMPRGPEQDSLLEYYTWHDFHHYCEQRVQRDSLLLKAWEEEQDQARVLWYTREEARLRQEAAELETPDEQLGDTEFPVEIEIELPFTGEQT